MGGEPTVGPERAWRLTFSPPSLALQVVYLIMAIVPRVRSFPPRALRAFDLGMHAAVGLCFLGITLSYPVPTIGMYELLLALTSLLTLRALLVPSSSLFTLAVGLVTALPSSLGVLGNAAHYGAPLVAPGTIRGIYGARCVLAIVLSSAVSAILYRLRRQVREARRLGQYTLEERLGQGGMGVVYRARHAMLRRPTAIKLLSGARGESLERFEREAQLTASLTHPDSIVVHDYGRTSDGTFYYAMEYLEGLDLKELVEMDGPQPPGRVVHLLAQACGALGEAHQLGLIHRDIKPANLFLCQRHEEPDFVKVLDFGLVKHLNGGAHPSATDAHAVLGTPLYMAPEVVSSPSEVDARSDVYAVGAVAYHLLTGSSVFTGQTAVEILAHHLHSAPIPPSERLGRTLPKVLDALVMRCLAKAPADRFAGAAELREALRACRLDCPWTSEEAAEWWRTRVDRIRRSREDRQDSWSQSALSISVEPHDHGTMTRRARRTGGDGLDGVAVSPRGRA